ncbi:MAG: H-type lectin domain-containing protein [Paracoccus sp. (in: a-proteobacteria)]
MLRGTTLVFSAFEDNGEMWTGQGPRVASHTVNFEESFLAEPVVHVSISMWDMGAAQNGRADISAEEVSVEGFRIVFRTWGDTRVARVRAEWIAIGPVRHGDDFVGI